MLSLFGNIKPPREVDGLLGVVDANAFAHMNFCGDGGRFRRQTQVVQGLADKQDVPCGVQAIFRTG